MSEKYISPSKQILARIETDSRKFREDIEGALLDHPKFDAVEVNKFREITAVLVDMVNEAEDHLPETGSQNYGEVVLFELNNIIDFLDKKDFWKYRFTTSSGSDTGGELLEDPLDSVYYLTSSGALLRIKRSVAVGDYKFHNGVQPFSEATFFTNTSNKKNEKSGKGVFSQKPVLGWSVQDVLTSEFRRILEADVDFNGQYVSKIGLYKKDDEIVAFNYDYNDDGIWRHSGDSVNTISIRDDQAERLKKMGHSSVMEVLKRKYGI